MHRCIWPWPLRSAGVNKDVTFIFQIHASSNFDTPYRTKTLPALNNSRLFSSQHRTFTAVYFTRRDTSILAPLTNCTWRQANECLLASRQDNARLSFFCQRSVQTKSSLVSIISRTHLYAIHVQKLLVSFPQTVTTAASKMSQSDVTQTCDGYTEGMNVNRQTMAQKRRSVRVHWGTVFHGTPSPSRTPACHGTVEHYFPAGQDD